MVKTKKSNGANLGFEEKLWAAADKMREHADPAPRKSYNEWSKEELVREIRKLEKRKKYGIVWEDKPEQAAELCKENLPVLVEDKSREIAASDDKLTNILIEGDNYHGLSVLNYTHKGTIDLTP